MVTSKSFRMMIRLDGREHEKDLTHWREVNQVFLQVAEHRIGPRVLGKKWKGEIFLPFQMEGGYYKYLNFGPWSTKPSGTVWAIKK